MKPCRHIQILVLSLVVGTGGMSLTGQSPFDPSYYPDAYLIRDHVELFTDRSMYVVGESIQFRADYRVDGVDEGLVWSTVLYVELVTSSGQAVSRGKYLLSEGMGSGSLLVPGSALTGNYFLKSYTRWMRNSGSQSFSYVPLTIINPFKSEVSNYGQDPPMNQSFTQREYARGYMKCALNKSGYGRGEEVRVLLSDLRIAFLPFVNCCLTVVPAGGIDLDHGQVTFYPDQMNPKEYGVNYLPDMMGVALSGTVGLEGRSYKPAGTARIYFSILGDQPDYFASVTDAQGRFVFSIPDRTGIQEFFVAPDPSAGEGMEVRIDQDFDEDQIPFSSAKFGLTDQERESAIKMALQAQLPAIYKRPGSVEEIPSDSSDRWNNLFYGTPGFTLLMDDYVTLPTLEEVFVNLVPDIEVMVNRGRRSLKVNGPNRAIQFYPPLIMIDHLPVFDQQVILNINPEKIRKIDLINEVYVKGGVAHGGVISIFSRNGDMAGIDLPAHSYFFDFLSIQPSEPKETASYFPGDRVPDMRNTISWINDIRLEKGSSKAITFKAPAVPGDYVILVRGLAHQGHVISATASFSVE